MDTNKVEELFNQIKDLKENPCGRNTSYYGPSTTERTIIKILDTMQKMLEMLVIENQNLHTVINSLNRWGHVKDIEKDLK